MTITGQLRVQQTPSLLYFHTMSRPIRQVPPRVILVADAREREFRIHCFGCGPHSDVCGLKPAIPFKIPVFAPRPCEASAAFTKERPLRRSYPQGLGAKSRRSFLTHSREKTSFFLRRSPDLWSGFFTATPQPTGKR